MPCNNPIHILHLEAERLFKRSREVACIVSLGTGRKMPNEIAESTLSDNFVPPTGLLQSIKKLATSCEREAERMELKYSDMDNVYFRLNVDSGMENVRLDAYKELANIRDRTMIYLERPAVVKNLDSIAALLAGKEFHSRQRYSLGQLCMCAPPVPVFFLVVLLISCDQLFQTLLSFPQLLGTRLSHCNCEQRECVIHLLVFVPESNSQPCPGPERQPGQAICGR